MLGPADAAVVVLAAHIHAQMPEALARLPQQVADALDGVDLQPQRRQDRALVAGAGAHFEHLGRGNLQHRFGHARHHPGLGDGLAMADWQRGVFVGARGQRFIDEQMPRHGAHCIERGLVLDAGLAQALDQAVAHALRGHADPDRFRLQAQPRRHAGPSSAAVSPPTQPATVSSAW